jgi:hypothetical protein
MLARAVIAAAVAGGLLLVWVARAGAITGPYVSLGDSYTAAPLVPDPTGNPIGCGRSTNNYPSDIARALALSPFTDASCSSATTADMTQSQSVPFGGTNPPQFNSLAPGDSLVTVGIGGNDAGLISVAEECASLDIVSPFGTRCKNHYASSGGDPNVAAIEAAGPKVAEVIQGIRARANAATRIIVVGYPDGLPVDGSNCWPLVPMLRRHQVLQRPRDAAGLRAPVGGSRERRHIRRYVPVEHRPRRLQGARHRVGQRHRPDVCRVPASPEPGGRAEHGQPGARRPEVAGPPPARAAGEAMDCAAN